MEEDEGAIGCLSCMKTEHLCDLFAVYGLNNETYTLMLETCFNIQISNELKYICEECAMRLENAYQFKQQTVTTINMLLGVKDEEYLDERLLEEGDAGEKKESSDDNEVCQTPEMDTNSLRCDLCAQVLGSDEVLENHLKACHNVHSGEGNRKYPCHFCNNIYSGRKACYTHLRMKHGLKLSSETAPKPVRRERKVCHICRKDFSQKQILNKHLWNEHGYEVEKRKAYACPLCDERVSYGTHFEGHLLSKHRFKQRVCRLEFNNMEEFKTYKTQIQEDSRCRFRKTTASKPTVEGLRSHYMCSQSGMYVYQGKGIRPAPERQIYKTGKACPAHMVVTETVDRVLLTFYMSHVGHGACPYYVPREPKKPRSDQEPSSHLFYPSPSHTVVKREAVLPEKKTSREWICDTCGDKLHSEMMFKQHLASHCRKLYPCQRCDLIFENVEAWSRHFKTEHSIQSLF